MNQVKNLDILQLGSHIVHKEVISYLFPCRTVTQLVTMTKYRVTYDRDGCISAAACVGVDPVHWVLDAVDGRANLVGGLKDKNGVFELEIDESQLQKLKESAEVCPVLIIHIFNVETGEKIF